MTTEKPQETISFADDLRVKAENARAKKESEIKVRIEKEIEPIRNKCIQAAEKGENEIVIPQGSISKDGVNALRSIGLRVSNFETQYASITVAWDPTDSK